MRGGWLLFAGLAPLALILVSSESDASFVAVGSGGAVLTSPDGINWTPQTSGTTIDLRGVASDGTQWLAVGNYGTFITSTTGTSWSPVCPGSPGCPPATSTSYFTAVHHGAGLWVAVGTSGSIYTSPGPPAWAWTSQSSPYTPSALCCYDVHFNGLQWVVVGGNGGTGFQAGIMTSPPSADSWTPRPNGNVHGTLHGIQHHAGQWIAVGSYASPFSGRLATSPDGVVWTDRLIPPTYVTAIDSDGTTALALGFGSVQAMSADAISWSSPATSGLSGPHRRLTHDGCIWAATASGIILSADGLAWTPQVTGPALLQDVAALPAASCPAPQCSPATASAIAGSAVTFTGTGGFAPYQWTAPGSTNPGPAAGASFTTSYPGPGTFTVTLQGMSTSTPRPSTTCTVTVVDPLTCGPSTQDVVAGATTSFTSTGGLASHSWSAPGGSPASGVGSGFAATFAPGTYTVTVSDASPAQSATCSVNAVPVLSCNPGMQTILVGDVGSLTATGGVGTYSWTTTGSTNNGPASGASFTAQFTSAGTRSVTLSDGGPPGQTVTCTVQVNDPPPLVCTVYTPVVTVGDVAIFDAAGGTPAYGWTAPAGAPDTGAGPTFATSYAAAGLQTVLVADTSYVTQSAGCPLAVAWPPLACALANGGYAGSLLAFNATGGSGTYSWSAPSGDPSTGSGSTFATSFALPGVYAVAVTSDSLVQTCMVLVANPPPPPPAPGLEYPGTPWTLLPRIQNPPTPSIRIDAPCGATTVGLSGALSYDSDGLVVAWLWDLGVDGRRDERETTFAAASGLHPIRLTVVDDTGLAASMGVDVAIGACPSEPAVAIGISAGCGSNSCPAAPDAPDAPEPFELEAPAADAALPTAQAEPHDEAPVTTGPGSLGNSRESTPPEPGNAGATFGAWWATLLLPFAVAGLFYVVGRRRRRA